MARSLSSRRWLKEHFSDKYVKRARAEGYPARSVYKLIEIDERYKLIKPGMTIVDLGAAPGGFSVYASEKLDGRGTIIAVDLLPLASIPNVVFVQGDFTDDACLRKIESLLNGKPVDLILSDMAPNLSGIALSDQARSMALAEQALVFAKKVLKKEGALLLKVFQGEGFQEFYRMLQQSFVKVKTIKPEASRTRSREVYLLVQGVK